MSSQMVINLKKHFLHTFIWFSFRVWWSCQWVMLGAVLEKVFKCSSINNMFEVGKKSVLSKVWQHKDT